MPASHGVYNPLAQHPSGNPSLRSCGSMDVLTAVGPPPYHPTPRALPQHFSVATFPYPPRDTPGRMHACMARRTSCTARGSSGKVRAQGRGKGRRLSFSVGGERRVDEGGTGARQHEPSRPGAHRELQGLQHHGFAPRSHPDPLDVHTQPRLDEAHVPVQGGGRWGGRWVVAIQGRQGVLRIGRGGSDQGNKGACPICCPGLHPAGCCTSGATRAHPHPLSRAWSFWQRRHGAPCNPWGPPHQLFTKQSGHTTGFTPDFDTLTSWRSPAGPPRCVPC